ncbi:MAG: hypothetical protein P9F75_01575 [Candidatus Contendobacter sp.]|nr:hypothetical protein [Candidatus Contendobacter sp.]
MQWIRRKPGPWASRLRFMTDLVFAITLLTMIVLALLGGMLGVMYWTKVDLNIDLFKDHIFEFFEILRF